MGETKSGLLGDTPERDYSNKLELFNLFAEPEFRSMISKFGLRNGDRVLDVGCGVGLITIWIAEAVAPEGEAIGIDLSVAHITDARSHAESSQLPVRFVTGDMHAAPFENESFDLIFVGNTIHHAHDPVDGLRGLAQLLRPGGQLIAGQSTMIPDMYFAWDERLEWQVNQAVRRYYRDLYNLSERDLTSFRRTFGLLREAGLSDVSAHTTTIERTDPLSELDRQYFQHCVFEGYWGQRLQPYLAADDWEELELLCDPASATYALDRIDFHHIQTYTVLHGRKST